MSDTVGTRITLADFPEAPRGAVVSEEGWLVCGNEAWTIEEWIGYPSRRPITSLTRSAPYATEEERRAAQRDSRRRWNDRNRADPAYRAHEAELARRRKTIEKIDKGVPA